MILQAFYLPQMRIFVTPNRMSLALFGYLNGTLVYRDRVYARDVKQIYEGHEVAVHTVLHPNLNNLSDPEILDTVKRDRYNLSEIVGYDVIGMAYPCCEVTAHVKDVVRSSGEVAYSRTVTVTGDTSLPTDLFDWKCTARATAPSLEEAAIRFLESDPESPSLFSVWGHSYEFDIDNSWDRFERFCSLISGKADIFYGTNREVLLGR